MGDKERECSFCGVIEVSDYLMKSCESCGALYCPRHGSSRHCFAHVALNLPKRFKIFYYTHLAGGVPITRFGGNLVDMKQPLQRWHDDKSKVPVVEITSMKYHGVGVHWYIKIEEDDNPCLDTEGKWCEPWDDKDGKGRYESKKFDFEKDTAKWIRRILLKWYPRGPVHLVFPSADYEGVVKWFYKDGD